jgi:hypothetical protein
MLPNNPASQRRVLLKTYNFMGVLLYHMRIAGISIFELFTYLRASPIPGKEKKGNCEKIGIA